MRIVTLVTLLCIPAAFADDDEEFDLGSDFEIDFSERPTLMDYQGNVQQASKELNATPQISVSHPGGTVEIRCIEDATKITARVDYVISGTEEAPTKRFGDGIGLRTWGAGASGGVSVAVPYQVPQVKKTDIRLVVNIPAAATVTVNASRGWIQARGCAGFVKASAGRDGAYVDGALKGFAVTAATGDVMVVVEKGAPFDRPSAITASKGKVTLVLPLEANAKLDARGSAVSVSHTVAGSVASAAVTGNIGADGPTLRIRATGEVKVSPSR